jgi:hypothetical protein
VHGVSPSVQHALQAPTIHDVLGVIRVVVVVLLLSWWSCPCCVVRVVVLLVLDKEVMDGC